MLRFILLALVVLAVNADRYGKPKRPTLKCGGVQYFAEEHICCGDALFSIITYKCVYGKAVRKVPAATAPPPPPTTTVAPRPTEKCDGTNYFPDEHICCGGKLASVITYKCVYDKLVRKVPVATTAPPPPPTTVAPRPTEKCEGVNYFPDEHICCGGSLYSVITYKCVYDKAVKKVSYTPRYHDEQEDRPGQFQPYYKPAPPKRPTQQCDGTNYFPDEHICCGGKLASVRTYKCVYDKLVRVEYRKRPTKQCGGVNFFPDEHICCGDELFSVRTYVCVYGKAQKKHRYGYRQRYHDEEDASFRPSPYKPAPTPAPRPTKQCDGTNYFPEEHICCGGKLFSVRTYRCYYGNPVHRYGTYHDEEDASFRSSYYKPAPTPAPRPTKQCEGVNYFPDEHICCGGSLFSVVTYKCVYDKAVKVGATAAPVTSRPTQQCNGVNYFPDEHICCGGSLYSVITYKCVYDKAVKKHSYAPRYPTHSKHDEEEDVPTRYGATYQPPTTVAPRPTKQCDGTNYFPEEHICCGGKLFSVRTYRCDYGNPVHRYGTYHDEEDASFRHSYYKPAPTPAPRPTKQCDGTNYFPDEHICCGGKLASVRTYKCVYNKLVRVEYPKRPTKQCDGVNYFPDEHICCGGKLFSVRTYKCYHGQAQKKHGYGYRHQYRQQRYHDEDSYRYRQYQHKRPTLQCGGVKYFADEHICCGGKLFSVRTYRCYYGNPVRRYGYGHQSDEE